MDLASGSSCLEGALMLNYALSLVWPSQMRSHKAVTAQVLNAMAPLLPLLLSRLESVVPQGAHRTSEIAAVGEKQADASRQRRRPTGHAVAQDVDRGARESPRHARCPIPRVALPGAD